MKPRGFVEWRGSFYIPLTQGQITIVDPGNASWLGQWNWYVVKDRCGNWRVQRQIRHGQEREYISMPRLIMQTPAGMTVDHISGDTLDNRKINLRNCTLQHNLQNQKVTKGRQYTGVYPSKSKINPWVARIKAFDKQLYLGNFATPELAASAWNEACIEYRGEFARLNVISKKETPEGA